MAGTESIPLDYWLPEQQEEGWLGLAKELPMAGIMVFGGCCWLWVLSQLSAPPPKGALTKQQESLRRTHWAQAAVTVVHSITFVVLGSSLLLNRAVQQACEGRLYCWSFRLQMCMESMLGYLLFDGCFSAFKAKRWLLPLGWAEDLMLLFLLVMQRVYPCVAVLLVFPWWLLIRGAGVFWGVDHMVQAAPQPMWNVRFLNEMARTTAAVTKLVGTALLAFQMVQWVWDLDIAQYRLPHGLTTWSWPYSYIFTACLVFHVYVALKQLLRAVKLTRRALQDFESSLRPSAVNGAKAGLSPPVTPGKQLSGAQRRKALKQSRQ